jgi:hypothetical protein
MGKLQESFDATTRLQLDCRKIAISMLNTGIIDRDIAATMCDKAKALSKDCEVPVISLLMLLMIVYNNLCDRSFYVLTLTIVIHILAKQYKHITGTCKDLAEPGNRIEELLVTERSLLNIADTKSALKAAAIPFLALQKFHEELVMMSRQASKRAQSKARVAAQ